jgi:hypothetical protein
MSLRRLEDVLELSGCMMAWPASVQRGHASRLIVRSLNTQFANMV